MTDQTEEKDTVENERPAEPSASGSVSLAKKYRVGPFKKKKRYKGPHVTPAPVSTTPKQSFAEAVQPVSKPPAQEEVKAAPVYEGKLLPKSVRVLTFHSSDLSMVNATTPSSSRDYGFTFNRNGMNYDIRFFPQSKDPDYAQANHDKFTISRYEETQKINLCGRSMTRDEANYALDIIERELSTHKKQELSSILEQLRKNVPTIEVAGKDISWEEYMDEAMKAHRQPSLKP